MKKCECPCGCLAAPIEPISMMTAIYGNDVRQKAIEPISSLAGAFVLLGGKMVCPMCAEDFHRSAWL